MTSHATRKRTRYLSNVKVAATTETRENNKEESDTNNINNRKMRTRKEILSSAKKLEDIMSASESEESHDDLDKDYEPEGRSTNKKNKKRARKEITGSTDKNKTNAAKETTNSPESEDSDEDSQPERKHRKKNTVKDSSNSDRQPSTVGRNSNKNPKNTSNIAQTPPIVLKGCTLVINALMDTVHTTVINSAALTNIINRAGRHHVVMCKEKRSQLKSLINGVGAVLCSIICAENLLMGDPYFDINSEIQKINWPNFVEDFRNQVTFMENNMRTDKNQVEPTIGMMKMLLENVQDILEHCTRRQTQRNHNRSADRTFDDSDVFLGSALSNVEDAKLYGNYGDIPGIQDFMHQKALEAILKCNETMQYMRSMGGRNDDVDKRSREQLAVIQTRNQGYDMFQNIMDANRSGHSAPADGQMHAAMGSASYTNHLPAPPNGQMHAAMGSASHAENALVHSLTIEHIERQIDVQQNEVNDFLDTTWEQSGIYQYIVLHICIPNTEILHDCRFGK